MNIFIVGPEGSGKTVFATMLNHHISSHPECGLTFRAGDAKTKLYFSNTLKLLKDGEWPSSTKGKLMELSWDWELEGEISNVRLVDPPGQEIRRELCGEANELKIVENIKKADIIILIVDIYGHMSASEDTRIENAWIMEHTLKNMAGSQRLIFAISKADLLTGSIPTEHWSDQNALMGHLPKMIPEFNLDGYAKILKKCTTLAFSAVAVESKLNPANNNLERIPQMPLTSNGLDFFIEEIKKHMLTSVEEEHERQTLEGCRKFLKGASKGVCVIIAIIVIIMLIRACYKPLETVRERECPSCGGDGIVNDDDWIPFNEKKCDRCSGSGRIRE